MAKHIVEYKLHDRDVPYFIEDGGYFLDTINSNKMVGVTMDDDCCYIPLASLVELTNQQLIARVEALSLTDVLGVNLTLQEKTNIANDWLISRGF